MRQTHGLLRLLCVQQLGEKLMTAAELRADAKAAYDEMQTLWTRHEERGEWQGDESEKYDQLGVKVEQLTQEASRLEKLEHNSAYFADLESGNERRTQTREIYQAQKSTPDAAKGPTARQRMLALQGWIGAGDRRGRFSPTAEHLEAAQRCGMSFNQPILNINLAPTAPSGLSTRDWEMWEKRTQLELRDVNVTTDADGGFAVPDEVMAPLERALLAFGGMRQVARVIRTATGADMPFPLVEDTQNSATIIGESTDLSETNLVFGQLVMGAYKYSSHRVDMTWEFLQDNAINAAVEIGSILGERIGRGTNAHFTTGTGSAQPNGVVTAAGTGVTADAATTISTDDLLELKHAVDPAYRAQGGRFMFHDDALLAIKKLKALGYSGAGEGVRVWQPGLAAGEPNTIDGDPYTINQDMASPASTAVSVLYGAFNRYIIRDVSGIQLIRMNERFAEVGVVAFVSWSRHDGDLLNAGSVVSPDNNAPVKKLTHPT